MKLHPLCLRTFQRSISHQQLTNFHTFPLKLLRCTRCRSVSQASASFLRLWYSTSNTRNHYETLNIDHDASAKQVKAAYFELSKKYHPDSTPAGHCFLDLFFYMTRSIVLSLYSGAVQSMSCKIVDFR